MIRSGEARLVGWSRSVLYSGFNILPRSVFWSADFYGRSDNLDVIRLHRDKFDHKDLTNLNSTTCVIHFRGNSGSFFVPSNSTGVLHRGSYGISRHRIKFRISFVAENCGSLALAVTDAIYVFASFPTNRVPELWLDGPVLRCGILDLVDYDSLCTFRENYGRSLVANSSCAGSCTFSSDNRTLIRSGEAPVVGWSRQMLYLGFNILPRSVIRSANSIDRSDNLDVIPLG